MQSNVIMPRHWNVSDGCIQNMHGNNILDLIKEDYIQFPHGLGFGEEPTNNRPHFQTEMLRFLLVNAPSFLQDIMSEEEILLYESVCVALASTLDFTCLRCLTSVGDIKLKIKSEEDARTLEHCKELVISLANAQGKKATNNTNFWNLAVDIVGAQVWSKLFTQQRLFPPPRQFFETEVATGEVKTIESIHEINLEANEEIQFFRVGDMIINASKSWEGSPNNYKRLILNSMTHATNLLKGSVSHNRALLPTNAEDVSSDEEQEI